MPSVLSNHASLVLQLMAPEAELLTMGRVVDSQNALYSVLRSGLVWCDRGIGPRFSRGRFIPTPCNVESVIPKVSIESDRIHHP